jgi:hypothetical protein
LFVLTLDVSCADYGYGEYGNYGGEYGTNYLGEYGETYGEYANYGGDNYGGEYGLYGEYGQGYGYGSETRTRRLGRRVSRHMQQRRQQ